MWYRDGLRFGCTQCGQCCTGAPGYVWISDAEMEKIAEFLKIDVSTFQEQYTKRIGNRTTLTEKEDSYDCIFLRNRLCTIYTKRPKQCRTFPWWKENLLSEAHWQKIKTYCEGAGHPDHPIVSAREIDEQLSAD